MPIYELQCIDCGKIEEKLFLSYFNFMTTEQYLDKLECEKAARLEKFKKENPGWDLIETICIKENNQVCSCGGFQELIPSLCVVQPDTMWAGQNTVQGYFTSKSEYNKLLKEKNLETLTSRSDIENVRKNVAKAKAAKKEKQLNNLIKHLTNELKGVTIDPDGNTLKETNKYVRARNKPTE
jgi:hypothetical protein